MKFYRGNAAAARNYVEADRSRADDYYLAEGSGVAERYVASRDASASVQVQAGGSLDGNAYERWVAGFATNGTPKGRLRKDDHALRFVEVVVNGPKTWSLAASVDPVISAAYDTAQDRAVGEIISWLGEHSRTRVGPRGAQVQIPVEEIEAAVVRHYTSRAGDPHRHLHLQINVRVFAAGKWRGLHTAATRDSIEAINGIGHAAIACDPEFRSELTSRGYTLDPESGEITQLAPYSARFSARAAQIARNTERFEAQWRAEHPEEEPGPTLRQAWDRRAWATARPDKIVPKDGAELAQRWRHELADLGFTPPALSLPGSRRDLEHQSADRPLQAGEVPRNAIARQVIAQLGAAHSAWNAADIRGAVERHLASLGLVAETSVRVELAEDITARAVAACVPLLSDRAHTPEHIRGLTSRRVLEVEAQITDHLAERGRAEGTFLVPSAQVTDYCTQDQEVVVSALAGTAPLVVVEGAAGAGKTFTLRATRLAMREDSSMFGPRLLVVAPTQKAAQVVQQELDEPAFSAAKFIHEYGYRWNDRTGDRWREPVDIDALPSGLQLRKDDLLIVDEAGMLDQDTTLALLEIANERGARVGFIGDRHQLAAVGRGGVLDHAIRLAAPGNVVTLDSVHRFRDPAYARLTLEIRAGFNAEDTFAELLERGHIHIHHSEAERTAALTQAGLDGEAVIAESRETVAALNAHIQDAHHAHHAIGPQGMHEGRPTHPAGPPAYPDFSRLGSKPLHPRPAHFETRAGQTLHIGDQVATRRNNPDLDVANRERWTITAINTAGSVGRDSSQQTIRLTGARGSRTVPASYARADLELAYATTVHGAQGETVDRAHFALTDTSTAAATYVGLTRGRDHNTIHIVADNEETARDLWVTAFNRDRSDLGPAQARNLALENLEHYGHDWNGLPWSAGLTTDERIRPNTTLLSTLFNLKMQELNLQHGRHDQPEEPTRRSATTEDYETTSSTRSRHQGRTGPTENYGPSI